MQYQIELWFSYSMKLLIRQISLSSNTWTCFGMRMLKVYPLSKIKMHSTQLLSLFIILFHRSQRHIQNIWFWDKHYFCYYLHPHFKGIFYSHKNSDNVLKTVVYYFFLKDRVSDRPGTQKQTLTCTHRRGHMHTHVHTQRTQCTHTCTHACTHTHLCSFWLLWRLSPCHSFSACYYFILKWTYFYNNSTWSLKNISLK